MVQCTSQHLVNCADCPLLARHLDDYIEMGHPYVRDYMLSSEFTWVLCMSPLMSKLLSESDFMEADVTYKASVELEYLFNAVVFNYTTLRCEFHFTCIHVTNLHVHSIKFLCPCMYNFVPTCFVIYRARCGQSAFEQTHCSCICPVLPVNFRGSKVRSPPLSCWQVSVRDHPRLV